MRQLRLGRSVAWMGWGTVAVLAGFISVVSLRLLSFNPEALSEELRPNLINHPIVFYAHTVVAPLALLFGVWQFLPATRRSSYHRWAGRLYVVCVAFASIAGFVIATTTEIGLRAGAGFMILAVLWFIATTTAYFWARTGNFVRHRVWMIRSYALTCAAITLRIILPAGTTLGASFADSYIVAAWGSWIINLLIAEWIIRRARFREAVPLRLLRVLPLNYSQ
jgi:uncharacterized membrane protein